MFFLIIFLLYLYSINACETGNYSLVNKTVIVTGAAQGIGYAIADNFLAEGARTIIIVDKNATFGIVATHTFNSKYGSNKAVFYHCHIFRDIHCWDQILLIHKKIDILVNNAGVLNEYETTEMVQTNVAALIYWSFKFREHGRTDYGGRGGTIINLSSEAGYLISPFMSAYSATKHAVRGFTKNFGHDYNCRKTGVRVVAICPDFTFTEMTRHQMVEDDQLEDFKKIRDAAPVQSADDVGKAVVVVYKNAKTGSLWTVSEGKIRVAPVFQYHSTELIKSL